MNSSRGASVFERENNSVWPSLIDLYRARLFRRRDAHSKRDACQTALTFFATSPEARPFSVTSCSHEFRLRDGDERVRCAHCVAHSVFNKPLRSQRSCAKHSHFMGQTAFCGGETRPLAWPTKLSRSPGMITQWPPREELKSVSQGQTRGLRAPHRNLPEPRHDRHPLQEAFAYIERQARILTDLLSTRPQTPTPSRERAKWSGGYALTGGAQLVLPPHRNRAIPPGAENAGAFGKPPAGGKVS